MSDTVEHFSPMSSGMNFSSLLYPAWSTNNLNLTPAIVCYSDLQESRYMYFSLLKVILADILVTQNILKQYCVVKTP